MRRPPFRSAFVGLMVLAAFAPVGASAQNSNDDLARIQRQQEADARRLQREADDRARGDAQRRERELPRQVPDKPAAVLNDPVAGETPRSANANHPTPWTEQEVKDYQSLALSGITQVGAYLQADQVSQPLTQCEMIRNAADSWRRSGNLWAADSAMPSAVVPARRCLRACVNMATVNADACYAEGSPLYERPTRTERMKQEAAVWFRGTSIPTDCSCSAALPAIKARVQRDVDWLKEHAGEVDSSVRQKLTADAESARQLDLLKREEKAFSATEYVDAWISRMSGMGLNDVPTTVFSDEDARNKSEQSMREARRNYQAWDPRVEVVFGEIIANAAEKAAVFSQVVSKLEDRASTRRDLKMLARAYAGLNQYDRAIALIERIKSMPGITDDDPSFSYDARILRYRLRSEAYELQNAIRISGGIDAHTATARSTLAASVRKAATDNHKTIDDPVLVQYRSLRHEARAARIRTDYGQLMRLHPEVFSTSAPCDNGAALECSRQIGGYNAENKDAKWRVLALDIKKLACADSAGTECFYLGQELKHGYRIPLLALGYYLASCELDVNLCGSAATNLDSRVINKNLPDYGWTKDARALDRISTLSRMRW